MRQGCRHSHNVLELWREWALVVPASQMEASCGGRFDHSEPIGDTTMVGAIGSYLDFGSMSGGIPEPTSAGEEICSVGVPSVREGEFVDIEVDSGAEVSCLPAHRR